MSNTIQHLQSSLITAVVSYDLDKIKDILEALPSTVSSHLCTSTWIQQELQAPFEDFQGANLFALVGSSRFNNQEIHQYLSHFFIKETFFDHIYHGNQEKAIAELKKCYKAIGYEAMYIECNDRNMIAELMKNKEQYESVKKFMTPEDQKTLDCDMQSRQGTPSPRGASSSAIFRTGGGATTAPQATQKPKP